MSRRVDCERVERDAVAEQYLAGRLPEEVREAFEEHYFECEACFAKLGELRIIREEVRRAPARSRGKYRWVPVAALAAAAVIAAWFASPRSSTPTVAKQVPRYAELARFDPPSYQPVILRGGEDAARRQFQSAMELYQQRKYPEALRALEAVADRAERDFFLAACKMLTGDPLGAVGDARRVLTFRDSPFEEDARLLIAKALLTQEDAAGAEVELRAVVALNGDHRAEADALLGRLAALK